MAMQGNNIYAESYCNVRETFLLINLPLGTIKEALQVSVRETTHVDSASTTCENAECESCKGIKANAVWTLTMLLAPSMLICY